VIAFRQGLKEAGFVEGENVAIEYRSYQTDKLPLVVADHVRGRHRLTLNSQATSVMRVRLFESAIVFLFCVFAKNSSPCNLRLFQHKSAL
jgi:hypothetical protein